MSWVRIWAHIVFTTKNRDKILSEAIRHQVFEHIKQNAKEKNIWIDTVNGYLEHIHCLVSLNREYSISKTSQLIKGESSRWINSTALMGGKFYWQDDYWAVGVSESHLDSVREYIKNQEAHHRVKSFSEEISEFMAKYGWAYEKD
ncbi:MAG TPA: IS200/IS605 family transposase [Ignavibacteriaceae bacterium]